MENVFLRARCKHLEMKTQHEEITVILGLLLLQPSAGSAAAPPRDRPRAALWLSWCCGCCGVPSPHCPPPQQYAAQPHPRVPLCHPVPSTRAVWELVQRRMSLTWVHCWICKGLLLPLQWVFGEACWALRCSWCFFHHGHDHRIIESFEWEGTLKDHLVQPPAMSRDTHSPISAQSPSSLT